MTDEIKEIIEFLKPIENRTCATLENAKCKLLLDYITNLQEKVNQYENPDDMTLFYMWIDEKAKDKMKQLEKERNKMACLVNDLQEENDYYFKKNNELSSLNTSLRSDRDNYKSRIDKARHKLNIMFSNGNEDIILDDLLELDKILGGNDE